MNMKKVEFLQTRYYVGLGDRAAGTVEDLNITLANGLIAAGLAKEVRPQKRKEYESDSE